MDFGDPDLHLVPDFRPGDEEPDRRDEPVPRSEHIEGLELADANSHFVMEPRPEGNAGPSEEDQENPDVEQELLSEPGPSRSADLVEGPLVLGILGSDWF